MLLDVKAFRLVDVQLFAFLASAPGGDFLESLALEDETDRLFRNFGAELRFYAG
jgi:hypothetical protein